MNPTFWLTVQIGKKRISLPIPLIFFLALVIEILALLPLTVYAIRKKEPLLRKLATSFYLSRLTFILIFYGHGLKIRVVINK